LPLQMQAFACHSWVQFLSNAANTSVDPLAFAAVAAAGHQTFTSA
jgi:hypothetical protein